MANTYTRLAALRPANTDETELYATAASQYIVANLFVCNQDSTDRTFRVAITDASGAATDEDWIYYDTVAYANMTYRFKIALGGGDTVRIRSGTADVISFVLTGLLIT